MESDYGKLLNDNQHGATYIVKSILNYIYDNRERLDSEKLLRLSKDITEAYPSMAQMYYLSDKIKYFALGKTDINELLSYFDSIHGEALNNCLKEIIRLSPERIVTISYSSQVISLLRAYSSNKKIFVTIGEGLPGGEGIIAAEKLRSRNITVRVVKDKNLKRIARKKDLVVVGADAVGKEWFINKEGTFETVIWAELAGVPSMVCSAKDKIVDPKLFNLEYDTDYLIKNWENIINSNFELIPRTVVSFWCD